MLVRMSGFVRKQSQGSIFRRFASFTGSFRSNTPTTETSTHGTNGTPIPQRRNMIKSAGRVPRDSLSSKDDSQTNYSVAYTKNGTIDKTLMSQDNV